MPNITMINIQCRLNFNTGKKDEYEAFNLFRDIQVVPEN
jgi:hypothetical protein